MDTKKEIEPNNTNTNANQNTGADLYNLLQAWFKPLSHYAQSPLWLYRQCELDNQCTPLKLLDNIKALNILDKQGHLLSAEQFDYQTLTSEQLCLLGIYAISLQKFDKNHSGLSKLPTTLAEGLLHLASQNSEYSNMALSCIISLCLQDHDNLTIRKAIIRLIHTGKSELIFNTNKFQFNLL